MSTERVRHKPLPRLRLDGEKKEKEARSKETESRSQTVGMPVALGSLKSGLLQISISNLVFAGKIPFLASFVSAV